MSSLLAIHHDHPEVAEWQHHNGIIISAQVSVSRNVDSLLSISRQYIVQVGDKMSHIEKALGISFGPNSINIEAVVGKVVSVNNGFFNSPFGTSFPVQAAAN